ncbi:MAG: hypothetical protein JWP10_374, partial [Nocardioidaceae bacterium]|nr:hypothetical protein [Nocardioidaceae bacterium]
MRLLRPALTVAASLVLVVAAANPGSAA